MQTDKRKEKKLGKNCLYWSFISVSLVELYTHLVPGDALFLHSNATATSKIITNNMTMAIFTVWQLNFYNTNIDDMTFGDTIRSYTE